MTLIRVLVIGLLFSLLACGPTEQPRPNDLIGVYNITAKSRETLTRKGYRNIPPIAVVIEPDGAMRLENTPDCVFDGFGEGHGEFISHKARWRCCEKPSFWTVLEGLPLWFEIDGKAYGTLLLKGRTPPYSLNFVIGDPDSNEVVVLEKG